MKAIFFPAIAVLLSAATATAQSTLVAENTPAPTISASAEDHHDCVSATTQEAWTSLGLSAEQITKVREIQATHRKECAEMKAEGDASKEIKEKKEDKHAAEIKAVLTADQYTKWQEWCAKQPAHTDPEKK